MCKVIADYIVAFFSGDFKVGIRVCPEISEMTKFRMVINMKSIYAIPIDEVFETGVGCPFCALGEKLERESLEYILGAAMMEPQIRRETNALGFCRGHFTKMLGMKNRLALALILESHSAETAEVLKLPAAPRGRFGGHDTLGGTLSERGGTCFVCDRVQRFETKTLSNVLKIWKTDESFRPRFESRSYCLGHVAALLSLGEKELGRDFSAFRTVLTDISSERLGVLQDDLKGFIRSFDHRFSAETPTEAQRASVEEMIAFLEGGRG